MKIRRTVLKIKSGFYYYTLLLIGSAGLLFMVRCSNPQNPGNTEPLKDSQAREKQKHDSIVRADSSAKAKRDQAIADSVKKYDSIAKAKKKIKKQASKPNQFIPVQPVVDYGVVPVETPATKYGIPVNDYKN
jgi:hypothetical protein